MTTLFIATGRAADETGQRNKEVFSLCPTYTLMDCANEICVDALKISRDLHLFHGDGDDLSD